MKEHRNILRRKLSSDRGASLIFALVLFLVCTTIGVVVLVAGTSAAGRLSQLAEMDQRYYAVQSAAQLLREEIETSGVTIQRTLATLTVTTTEEAYRYQNEDGSDGYASRWTRCISAKNTESTINNEEDWKETCNVPDYLSSTKAGLDFLNQAAMLCIEGEKPDKTVPDYNAEAYKKSLWNKNEIVLSQDHELLESSLVLKDGGTQIGQAVTVTVSLDRYGMLKVELSCDEYSVVMTFDAQINPEVQDTVPLDLRTTSTKMEELAAAKTAGRFWECTYYNSTNDLEDYTPTKTDTVKWIFADMTIADKSVSGGGN